MEALPKKTKLGFKEKVPSEASLPLSARVTQESMFSEGRTYGEQFEAKMEKGEGSQVNQDNPEPEKPEEPIPFKSSHEVLVEYQKLPLNEQPKKVKIQGVVKNKSDVNLEDLRKKEEETQKLAKPCLDAFGILGYQEAGPSKRMYPIEPSPDSDEDIPTTCYNSKPLSTAQEPWYRGYSRQASTWSDTEDYSEEESYQDDRNNRSFFRWFIPNFRDFVVLESLLNYEKYRGNKSRGGRYPKTSFRPRMRGEAQSSGATYRRIPHNRVPECPLENLVSKYEKAKHKKP